VINHPVWATPVPPVCTGLWNQTSWDKWNYAYKPIKYYGDPYSIWDWMLYTMHKDNDIVILFYMQEEARINELYIN